LLSEQLPIDAVATLLPVTLKWPFHPKPH